MALTPEKSIIPNPTPQSSAFQIGIISHKPESLKHLIKNENDLSITLIFIENEFEHADIHALRRLDLLVVDIDTEHGRGVYHRVKKEFPKLPIAVLSEKIEDARAYVGKGAISYLESSPTRENFEEMFDRVVRLQPSTSLSARMLLVEDPARPNLSNLSFSEKEFKMLHAHDEVSSIEQLWRHSIDIVLLDLDIGGKTERFPTLGYAIANMIRNNFPYVNLIVYSKDPMDPSLKNKLTPYETCLKADSFDVLEKTIIEAVNYQDKKIRALKTIGRPQIWCICGPSGVGKTSIQDHVGRMLPFTYKAIRAVTRDPRPYEVMGEDHVFLSSGALRDNSEYSDLVYAHVKGYEIGIDTSAIESQLASGNDVLLTIASSEGVKVLSDRYPQAHLIGIDFNREISTERKIERGDADITGQKAQYDAFEKLERRGYFDMMLNMADPDKPVRSDFNLRSLRSEAFQLVAFILAARLSSHVNTRQPYAPR